MSTTAKDNTSEMRIKLMITHDNAWITHDNAWITHDNTHITHGNASITRDNALLLPRFCSRFAVVSIFMSICCCVNFLVSAIVGCCYQVFCGSARVPRPWPGPRVLTRVNAWGQQQNDNKQCQRQENDKQQQRKPGSTLGTKPPPPPGR